MPATPPRNIVDNLLNAFIEAGCQALLTSAVRTHPRTFRVIPPEGAAFDVWVYIWTVTHGGGPMRAQDEFRIQLTSIQSPIPMNPNGPTVLLGLYPNLGVFAGFDIVRHRMFTPGSSSVQITFGALQSALNFGFGFSRKDTGEVAVAFRPGQILNYIRNAQDFHLGGVDAITLDVLNRVAARAPVPPGEIEQVPAPRRRIVEMVTRLSRDSNFRDQVPDAYGNRCAVTRAQLKLVEAAHILPVGADGSTDEVTNGIALSPTYHRAYDQGLIYLNAQNQMVINPTRVAYLAGLNLIRRANIFRAIRAA